MRVNNLHLILPVYNGWEWISTIWILTLFNPLSEKNLEYLFQIEI